MWKKIKRNIRRGLCKDFFNNWICAVQIQKKRFQEIVDESKQATSQVITYI